MQERTRTRTGIPGAGSGLGDPFGPPDDAARDATVAHGPYAEDLPVGGMSVGEVRRRYRDRFDIDPRSEAILDGDPVGDDVQVRAGQILTFIRRAGEKGRARP